MWRCSWKSVIPSSSTARGPRTVMAAPPSVTPRAVTPRAGTSCEVDLAREHGRRDAREAELELERMAARLDRDREQHGGRLLTANVEPGFRPERGSIEANPVLARGRVDEADPTRVDRPAVEA